MSLHCTVCRNPVPDGVNLCRTCNNGFVSQLACSSCGNTVVRGAAACGYCSTAPYRNERSQGLVPARQPHHLGELTFGGTRFDAGQYGAISDVSVPDGVADMFHEIGHVVQSLLTLANRLSRVAGTEGTRACIRSCRDLASRLQEELETRRGP